MHKSLVSMGIDFDIAMFALKYTQFESQERGIAFLFEKEENGNFEHPFI
jgi:hypothetical protein